MFFLVEGRKEGKGGCGEGKWLCGVEGGKECAVKVSGEQRTI